MEFDKRFSLGNIITVLMAAAALIYGYGVQGSRIDNLYARSDLQDREIQQLKQDGKQLTDVKISVVKVEEKSNFIIEQLQQVKKQLEGGR